MLSKFTVLNYSIELYAKIETLKMNRHLKDQILRSSSSIALNLAEGSGKSTSKDRIKYYQIAFGSIKETSTALKLARINDPKILTLLDQIGAMTYRLCNPK